MKQYTLLPVNCDLSTYWVENALVAIDQEVRDSMATYESIPKTISVHVSNAGFRDAKRWAISAMAPHASDRDVNTLGIYINLHIEEGFDDDEWCVSAWGRSYGSKGA